MATLMPVIEYSLTPCRDRQLDTAGTCAPTKTPVGLLRNARKSQPACSIVSHAQFSSIRTCGSVCFNSLWDIPNSARSKSSSSPLRISPSQGLASRPGPD